MRSATESLAFALAAWALAGPTPAGAILVRADRDDAEYRELATRYPASLALGVPDGEGTLIAPRWILTAAHMARAVEEQKPRVLQLNGKAHEVEAVFVHPDWKKGGHPDLALLQLKTAVTGIEPVAIYREGDEAGKTVRIAGHGYTGVIGEKPTREKWDRKARASINTVDRVTPRVLGLRIKPNDEASDLQGAAAPGDSGGPAFFEIGGTIWLAGVGYATDDANANGIVGDAGDWELYVRVSAFAAWIDAVMAEASAKEAAALLGDADRR